MPAATPPTGMATLRFGISGASTRSLAISVNGQTAGELTDIPGNSVINRDGVEGSWIEKDLRFDASLLKPGANTIILNVPAGSPMSGLSYDVIRLELATPGQK